MAHYLDIVDGKAVLTPKKGRTKKGYRQAAHGIWISTPHKMDVLVAAHAYPKSQVMSWINCAFTKQRKDVVSCFMCNVSPNCESEELLQHRYASRMDLDVRGGHVLIYPVCHVPDQPDVVIENLIAVET